MNSNTFIHDSPAVNSIKELTLDECVVLLSLYSSSKIIKTKKDIYLCRPKNINQEDPQPILGMVSNEVLATLFSFNILEGYFFDESLEVYHYKLSYKWEENFMNLKKRNQLKDKIAKLS